MISVEIDLTTIARLPNDKSRDYLMALFRREQVAQERRAQEQARKARARQKNAAWVHAVHEDAKRMLAELGNDAENESPAPVMNATRDILNPSNKAGPGSARTLPGPSTQADLSRRSN